MSRPPRLTELDDMGGDAWQSLMTQLLQAYAEHHGFVYRPGPTSQDGGVDGLAPDGGVPAMDGPVVFQAKWLWGEIHKGSKKSQIEGSLNTVAKARPEVRHWILVTPHDLTQDQQQWLFGLQPRADLKIHHWGHERLTGLMRKHCPELFARYYPLHATPAASPVFQHLLPTYLRQLIRQTERLDLSSLARNTVGEDAEQAPPLAELYTRLDVLRSREAEAGQTVDPRRFAELAERQNERQSATAFVSEHPRVALLGDPGSGKSTFANFLALVLAGEWLRREELDLAKLELGGMATVNLDRLGADWQAGALLPLRVLLREFASQRDGTGQPVEQFWRFLAAQMGPALADFLMPLQAHLRDAGGLLILDGYDEVPEAHGLRAFVQQAVAGFQTQLPGVRILLTSRTYAYQVGSVPLPDFVATVLAPFSKEQIDLFVEAWYAHHALRKGRLAEDAAGRATRLKHAIRQRPYLFDLARRPLLLTLMAALHAWRQEELPESREKLYEDSVDLLLYAWERRKRFLDADGQPRLQEESAAEWFKVPQEAIKKAFDEMAFAAHRQQAERTGAANIKEETVVAALLRASPNARQKQVLDYISQRAGLLIDRGNGVYCFPHRTFQEYLAARYLTEVKFPRLLVELARADVERWREAVLLAGAKVARGTPSSAWLLAQKLCSPWADPASLPSPDPHWWLTLLAGQLLLETGIGFGAELDTDELQCRVHIMRSLEYLVSHGYLPPSDRSAAGIALGKLGDERKGVGVKDGLPDIDWITLSPGPFKMGNNKGQTPYTGETPQFDCDVIQQPFAISRYPVTVAQFQAFVEAGGYEEPRFWTDAGWQWKQSEKITQPEDYDPVFQTPNHPHVGVSWYEAMAFCSWLAAQLQMKMTLPSEAEWERAARHTDGRTFPWGDAAEGIAHRCNISKTGLGHTSAVGMFPAGQAECSAADMAGNVWEWTRSLWGKDYRLEFPYPYRLDDQREDLNASSNVTRVLRGGSWGFSAVGARCACRGRVSPDYRYGPIGFRLVAFPFLR